MRHTASCLGNHVVERPAGSDQHSGWVRPEGGHVVMGEGGAVVDGAAGDRELD